MNGRRTRPPLQRRLKLATRYLAGHTNVRRTINVFDDDVLLASYPKSGNTWTRFLVANLLQRREPVTFANIERIVPDIYLHYDPFLSRIPRPRVIKTHESFDPRFRRIVLIVRDPRDVAVSYYHHLVKYGALAPDAAMGPYLERFVAGRLDAYGSWGDNVGSWLGARGHRPDFLLLRYEDLLTDATAGLRRVAELIGLDVDDQDIAHAVEASRAENMRKLEARTGDQWKGLKAGSGEGQFVRVARSGQWREKLSPEDVAAIERAFGPIMERVNYPLATEKGAAHA